MGTKMPIFLEESSFSNVDVNSAKISVHFELIWLETPSLLDNIRNALYLYITGKNLAKSKNRFKLYLSLI